VSKPGFEALAGLSMQDPVQALGVYAADPLVSAFDMDMGTGFGSASTNPGSYGTSGKPSQQSTSGSYDMMPYPEVRIVATFISTACAFADHATKQLSQFTFSH
jgi:hypothetical protein